jgi:hypothetical protein
VLGITSLTLVEAEAGKPKATMFTYPTGTWDIGDMV